MEWLEGGASGSAGQRDVEANVLGLNLHMRKNERWIQSPQFTHHYEKWFLINTFKGFFYKAHF